MSKSHLIYLWNTWESGFQNTGEAVALSSEWCSPELAMTPTPEVWADVCSAGIEILTVVFQGCVTMTFCLWEQETEHNSIYKIYSSISMNLWLLWIPIISENNVLGTFCRAGPWRPSWHLLTTWPILVLPSSLLLPSIFVLMHLQKSHVFRSPQSYFCTTTSFILHCIAEVLNWTREASWG